MSRIGRQSRRIDFSFISPKHTLGWAYLRKNSLKFSRFILRAKFGKDRSKFAYNGGFRGLKCSKCHASLRKQRGRKNDPMKMKLGTNIISFFYFKIVQLVSWSFVCSFLTKHKTIWYTHHLLLRGRNNQRPNLISTNGLWYIPFDQNIYILGNLGYSCSHQKSYSSGNQNVPCQ